MEPKLTLSRHLQVERMGRVTRKVIEEGRKNKGDKWTRVIFTEREIASKKMDTNKDR